MGEKRISDLENKKLISKADETPYFKLNKFPLIRIDIMDEYFQMAAREPKVDYDAMKSLATEYVLLPYPKNGIAGLIHQGECAPILNDGDIALFDPDEEIKENDLVGWTATSGKYGIGKISFSDKNDFVIQTLDGTTEHRINRKELTHIAKIVLTVRRW